MIWVARALESLVCSSPASSWTARRRLRLIAVAAASSWSWTRAGAAASRAAGAMAFELCDRALGVGLAIDRGIAAGRGAHPFSGGDRGVVLGSGLGRIKAVALSRSRVA